ncbi:sensor histidine kinase [Streptomyces sp. NBC_01264]|uniref:sensor histidine kinase n=1 Tax=Streptomyces sp. NBC_01264 TaxID=2903804 RepID=UPI002251A011|nr:ATP-binding protein [Streptomyces sp. NBC_01264]MCX4781814.1 hypothetical protein [Streptomyces sp. NBC_01264]
MNDASEPPLRTRTAGTLSGGGLAAVHTWHLADLLRIAAWLRFGFLAVLVLACALERSGGFSLPWPETGLVAGYGALVAAALAARPRLPVLRPYTRFAAALLWGDLAVVVVLQLISDGAPALALALFLVPMSAGFQLPVRHTATIAGVCLATYAVLLTADTRLRVRTDENTVAVLALFLLTCLACLAVARQHQERSERIDQLTCERAQLLAEVMSAEERERAVLAELLHDGPLQSVLAVRLELGTSRRLGGPDDVATARVRLLDIARQLRCLTAELHPLTLEATGIGHVLELLADTTVARAGLEGECVVTVDHDARHPDPREAIVFTAARELLNNVVLHAQATRFSVSLTDEAGVWRLEVRDDGHGIAPGEPQDKLLDGHIGLASLRVRTEAALGTLTIDSGPAGTCVGISLPPVTGSSAAAPASAGRGRRAEQPSGGTRRRP